MKTCTETRRSICINCLRYTTHQCEQGIENCRYPDKGPLYAGIISAVLLSILIYSIIYKLLL